MSWGTEQAEPCRWSQHREACLHPGLAALPWWRCQPSRHRSEESLDNGISVSDLLANNTFGQATCSQGGQEITECLHWADHRLSYWCKKQITKDNQWGSWTVSCKRHGQKGLEATACRKLSGWAPEPLTGINVVPEEHFLTFAPPWRTPQLLFLCFVFLKSMCKES